MLIHIALALEMAVPILVLKRFIKIPIAALGLDAPYDSQFACAALLAINLINSLKSELRTPLVSVTRPLTFPLSLRISER